MNHQEIVISVSQLSTMDHIINTNNKQESCALLLGSKKKNVYEIKEVIPMNNRDKSEVSFTMDENELLQIYKYADLLKISVIGIFHSHPSKPLPSETDKTFMEINPIPWLIKSTITDEMRCFVFSDPSKGRIDGIEEIKIVVVKD